MTVFRFVEREKAHHRVQTMCRLLGVSASGEVGFIVAKTDLELSASITLTFTRS